MHNLDMSPYQMFIDGARGTVAFKLETLTSSEDDSMAISQRFKRLFQQITSDSVSCGTLAIWAVAMGLLLVMMQFYSKSLLL
jgi:hypothetical protein